MRVNNNANVKSAGEQILGDFPKDYFSK